MHKAKRERPTYEVGSDTGHRHLGVTGRVTELAVTELAWKLCVKEQYSHEFDLDPVHNRTWFGPINMSLVQLSRRLVHFRNTSYPVALRRQRLWSRQLSQSSFRRVLQIPTLGVFMCAATAALVLYHHQNPVVLLDSLESTRGPLL